MSDFEIFEGKTLSSLFKDIHDNSVEKSSQIEMLIKKLEPLIKNVGDATIVVPLIKEYLDVSVKNDEQLVKIATIVQRLVSSQARTGGTDHEMISEDEKKQLLSELENVAFDVQDKMDELESKSERKSKNV
jgi:hypothetical protein|tara:strand:- start:2883 stop:3275 length:393 start_codon:yes stop_codon:yes gene_type:complete